MRAATWSAVVALVAVAVAGCSDDASSPATIDDVPEGAPELKATATTGVLRGIVVDEAIRPLLGAQVNVTGPSGSRTAVTGDDGFFGFQDLEPGTYFVAVSKLAHEGRQASAEVEAGVDDPPLLRVQLTFIPTQAPFVLELQHSGFAQCIVPGANACFIANFYPCLLQQAAGQACSGNLTNDDSVFHVVDPILELARTPDWAQVEMLWDTTQAVTDWLAFRISPYAWEDGGGVDDRADFFFGKSPVVFALNQSRAQAWDLGAEVDDGIEENAGPAKGFALETFSGGNDLTCTGAHLETLDTCSSLGLVVNQKIEFYFHLTYGFAPPEDWSFSKDGPLKPPT